MLEYETFDRFLDATARAGAPLHVVIYPPDTRRARYIAMHIQGLGWTDTRRYRLGSNKRERSEAYAVRMILDYIAITFDMTVEQVRDACPDIRFEWSPLTWEEFYAMDAEAPQ